VEVVEAILRAVPDSGARAYEPCGRTIVVVKRDALPDVMRFLHPDPQQAYEMLADVTAVDYSPTEGKLHVVYQLSSIARKVRLTVKVEVPSDDAVVPSLTSIWKSADWAEREVWDMFGVRFTGHPNLKRILMYEQFEGHPLRKDYPVDRRQPLVEERDPINNPWPSRDGL